MERLESKTDKIWVMLQEEPLDLALAQSFLFVPASGGINLFAGTSRQWTHGRETSTLFYECYPKMALAEMKKLGEAVCEKWPAERVIVWHRLGEVPLAEASVMLGVSTPHRAASFGACRFLIDTLKETVPIWKREHYADGSEEWVEGTT